MKTIKEQADELVDLFLNDADCVEWRAVLLAIKHVEKIIELLKKSKKNTYTYSQDILLNKLIDKQIKILINLNQR